MVLFLALLCSNYSNSQEVLTTGNLVNFTGTPTDTTGNWVNGVYVKQLGCFGGNTPGNCGPYPNVQTNGSINFSYGQVNLNQVVNVNAALASAGSGVQVTGFHFGFRAKNGNGWDNGQQDYLDAYVRFYNPQAKIVESYDYLQYTNRKYNWSDFNFNQTFDKPYDVSKLAAAQYGFIGRDTNYWAGPYGPEIINVNFSLNYKIDPCVANPTSSPTCPGFNNLIKTTTLSIPSVSTTISIPDAISSSTPIVNVGGVQLSTTGTISAPDNIPQALKDVQAVTQQSQSTPPAPPANSSPQQSNKSTPNMSLIMNLIGQIQAADKATQAAAVQNAQQVAATSSAKAQEQAMATVDTLNTMSAASSQAAQDRASQSSQAAMSVPQQSTAGSVVQMQGPTTSLQSLTASSNQSSGTGLTYTLDYNSSNKNQSVVTYTSQQISTALSIQPQVTETAPVQLAKIETRTIEPDTPAMPVTSSMPRGSSISEITEVRAMIEATQNEQRTETVKKDVQSNELAGGVDIAAMATQPKGFDVYALTIMKDSSFYAPKDIYGNQKTIDNARALRQLSSDRLHQELVDQQYKGR